MRARTLVWPQVLLERSRREFRCMLARTLEDLIKEADLTHGIKAIKEADRMHGIKEAVLTLMIKAIKDANPTHMTKATKVVADPTHGIKEADLTHGIKELEEIKETHGIKGDRGVHRESREVVVVKPAEGPQLFKAKVPKTSW